MAAGEGTMATMEKMKEVFNKQMQAFTAGDWKAYKETLKDDAIYEEEATGRRVQGRDAVVQTVEPWKSAFPDVKATIKEMIASGDALVVELEWTGTHQG